MFNAYFTVSLLVLINLINYMDRFTIAGVLSEIQNYFEINDKTSGLLQTSFICSYMLFSPLFGYLGDRYSRKYIIMFGVSFWSAMTLASSFVQPHHTYWFFLFRALVGIGEASYATVAPTLIADLFIGAKRSTMLAMFYFAIPVGSGLGYIVGIGMFKLFHHWTYALRFTPIFGFVSVVAFLFVTEPTRGSIELSSGHTTRNEEIVTTATEEMSFFKKIKSVAKDLRNDICYLISIPTYLLTTFGFTCVCFSVGALSWWAPTYMQNAIVDSDPVQIGLIFGVIACLGGLFGVLFGYLGSRYFRKIYPKADSWVCAVGVFASIPCAFLGIALARSSTSLSWLFIFLSITFLSTNWSVVVDILLYVIIPKKRALGQSLQILTSHILGDASSPFIVGVISDAFQSNPEIDKYHSLSYALYLTPIILIFGAMFFALSSLYIIQDETKCKQLIRGSQNDLSGEEGSGSSSESANVLNRTSEFVQSESSQNLINNNTAVHQRLSIGDHRNLT